MNGVDYSSQENEEVRKLGRQVTDLKEQNEFIITATAYFSKDK
jgi:transposase